MEILSEGLTLETLPKAFTYLTNEVSEIKRLLLEKSNEPTETDCWFDLNELCIYHPDSPTKSTVYGWVNAGTIPVHKGGKKLRFLKSEIDDWLKQGRKSTLAETTREAKTCLKGKEGNTSLSQFQTIFQYLSEHVATASMVADATGIYQKNICRYKRDLEKAGQLWEIEKKACKKTGFKAWYLTTNPKRAQKHSPIQLSLF